MKDNCKMAKPIINKENFTLILLNQENGKFSIMKIPLKSYTDTCILIIQVFTSNTINFKMFILNYHE